MTLNGLGSVSSLTSTSLASPIQIPGDTNGDGVVDAADAVSTDVSDPAKQLQALEDLAKSDPVAFKAKTAEIATKLKAMADQAGSEQAKFLTGLAAKFQAASDSGDVSALTKKAGRHGGHHGHHGPPPGQADQAGAAGATSESAAEKVKRYQQQAANREDLMASVDQAVQSILGQQGTTQAASGSAASSAG
jgi:hypothetical protein